MDSPETLHVDFEDDRTIVSRRAAGTSEFEVVEALRHRLTVDDLIR